VGKVDENLPSRPETSTLITDFLGRVWSGVSALIGRAEVPSTANAESLARELFAQAAAGDTAIKTFHGQDGASFSVATPITDAGRILGVIALSSPAGEIDRLVRNEREQILRMFLIALLVSTGLSMVLASTIANPLSDLAAAAEMGRDRNITKMQAGRVRIPDLAARPDEIGRLSIAMRGMVSALYDRIESNEQFAADVAHEIKNPLASLRSAVGTMRVAKRDDQREKLLDVIEHDVRRMDRLVTDISNASRLDSELVKEQETDVTLIQTLSRLCDHLGQQAQEKGVEFITDFPKDPIIVRGLEERLAQVFVNLISNAISFCEDGDAVRVWARQRDNRLLIVVEDTGPGIPEQALSKVFKRFYSDRPPTHFGNNSGLGLSISKQIVEAHGGVIWAENIRPTQADAASEPLGARFVVGLPI
jgi:two-component system sensor histidine kinase ChvG